MKQGSSVAGIRSTDYYFKDLLAAMLVPSGNDAAYVMADYCGGILSPEAKTSQERMELFMGSLNQHLQECGYKDTVLYDPSGYDMEAHTTVWDIKKATDHLLENQWFRDIVSQHITNEFLNAVPEYYNERITGVKTGSLANEKGGE